MYNVLLFFHFLISVSFRTEACATIKQAHTRTNLCLCCTVGTPLQGRMDTPCIVIPYFLGSCRSHPCIHCRSVPGQSPCMDTHQCPGYNVQCHSLYPVCYIHNLYSVNEKIIRENKKMSHATSLEGQLLRKAKKNPLILARKGGASY